MGVFTDRQLHKSFFQKSTLLFLCMLRPLSFVIQKQDSEIEAAKVRLHFIRFSLITQITPFDGGVCKKI